MTRSLLMICLAASLAGCASTHGPDKKAARDPSPTPTTQFSVALTHTPDEILLAPHDKGLSPAQAAAVEALAQRWRDAGDGPVTIQTPAGGGAEAYHGANAVEAALVREGLAEDQIRLVSYTPAPSATPTQGASAIQPIVVGFTHYEAKGPQCGRNVEDYTKTFSNLPNNNFGCAVTANFAAMIANPADLNGNRPMDPSDANRRETIVGHYRKGELMSSAKDPQANGAVSSVLQ
jgi:pilus assembly protein CpaD